MKATLKLGSSFVGCLFCLLVSLPSSLAAEDDDSKIARKSKIVEGITFHFPAGEEELVDLIAGDVVAWRQERIDTLGDVLQAIQASITNDRFVSTLPKALEHFTGIPAEDPRLSVDLVRNLKTHAHELANQWSSVMNGFNEVSSRLYSPAIDHERSGASSLHETEARPGFPQAGCPATAGILERFATKSDYVLGQ